MNITEEMDFKPKRKMTKEEALEQAAKEMFNVPFVDVETIEQEIEVYDKAFDLYAAPLREEIEALKKRLQEAENRYDNAIERNIDKREEIERLKAGQWVSVKERLPEFNEDVAVIMEHWDTKRKVKAVLKRVNEDDQSWRTSDDNSEVSYSWNVTHWTPLPPNPSAT